MNICIIRQAVYSFLFHCNLFSISIINGLFQSLCGTISVTNIDVTSILMCIYVPNNDVKIDSDNNISVSDLVGTSGDFVLTALGPGGEQETNLLVNLFLL